MCVHVFTHFCTTLRFSRLKKYVNFAYMQNMRMRICLNFGKFSQVLPMFVWPKFQMCGVHVWGLKICRNSQFVNFQLETQINWRIICTWKCNYYRHNNWNQNNCSNNRSWNKKKRVLSGYCMRAIIIRTCFETVLEFIPRILDLNMHMQIRI